jgi:hypothetical protein
VASGGPGLEPRGGCASRAAGSPLSPAGLSNRKAGLVVPAIATFLKIGEPRQLRYCIGVQRRQGEHDRFDAGEGEVFRIERRSGPAQAAMATPNDLLRLGPVGGAQDVVEVAGRPHDVTAGAVKVGIYRRERYTAEAYPVSVAGQAGAAPFHQPKQPGSLESHVKLPSQ